jgi:hypothetical protein
MRLTAIPSTATRRATLRKAQVRDSGPRTAHLEVTGAQSEQVSTTHRVAAFGALAGGCMSDCAAVFLSAASEEVGLARHHHLDVGDSREYRVDYAI